MTLENKTSFEKKPKFPDEFLEEAIELYQHRSKEYGAVWKSQGKIMKQFFPEGISLHTEADFEKFHIFNTILMKMKRIAEHIQGNCHPDSSIDAIVYHSFLLSYVEETENETKK